MAELKNNMFVLDSANCQSKAVFHSRYDSYEFNHSHHSGFEDAARPHRMGIVFGSIFLLAGVLTAFLMRLSPGNFVVLLASLLTVSAGIYGGTLMKSHEQKNKTDSTIALFGSDILSLLKLMADTSLIYHFQVFLRTVGLSKAMYLPEPGREDYFIVFENHSKDLGCPDDVCAAHITHFYNHLKGW